MRLLRMCHSHWSCYSRRQILVDYQGIIYIKLVVRCLSGVLDVVTEMPAIGRHFVQLEGYVSSTCAAVIRPSHMFVENLS